MIVCTLSKMITCIERLLCPSSVHVTRHGPHQRLVRKAFICPFYRLGNWGSETFGARLSWQSHEEHLSYEERLLNKRRRHGRPRRVQFPPCLMEGWWREVCVAPHTYIYTSFFQLCLLRMRRNNDLLLAMRTPNARSWVLSTILY